MIYTLTKINNKTAVDITCPNCNKITRVPVSRFKGKYKAKTKCACNNVFGVVFDSRDAERKKVNLNGFYDISKQKKADLEEGASVRWESVQIDRKVPNCKLLDVSRHGLQLITLDDRNIFPGDLIRVRFKLDNSSQTEIVHECEVRYIVRGHIGCRLLKDDLSLGFYMLDGDLEMED